MGIYSLRTTMTPRQIDGRHVTFCQPEGSDAQRASRHRHHAAGRRLAAKQPFEENRPVGWPRHPHAGGRKRATPRTASRADRWLAGWMPRRRPETLFKTTRIRQQVFPLQAARHHVLLLGGVEHLGHRHQQAGCGRACWTLKWLRVVGAIRRSTRRPADAGSGALAMAGEPQRTS